MLGMDVPEGAQFSDAEAETEGVVPQFAEHIRTTKVYYMY